MTSRLVILGSTVTALAVVRDAHAHGLEPCVLDTVDGIAFRSRWARGHRLPAARASTELLKLVCEFGGTDCWLIATSDHWLRWIASQRAELDGAFRAVLHPTNASLDVCLNKRSFAAWCRDNGLSAPKSWLAGTEPRPVTLRFPMLLRPAETRHAGNISGLPKALAVHDETQLSNWVKTFEDAGCPALVSESLLRTPLIQYSVPFARVGATLISFVARKVRPSPERCAVGTCVELSPHPEVEALARSAAEKLDYFGIGEAEILHSLEDRRNYLIEINARPWLQYALAPASNHDFLGIVVGQAPSGRAPLKTGRCWIDLRGDLFEAFSSSVGSVRGGKLGFDAYLASLFRANVFARFHLRDPRPAVPYKVVGRSCTARTKAM